MAFSIGGLLSGIASVIPGVSQIASLLFPPSKPKPRVSQRGPTAFPPPGTILRPAAFTPLAVAGVRGLIATLLGRASAAIGKRMSARSVVALINSLGLTAAAAALGLSVEEAAQIFASKPRRRRRGITARDISTTKRVINVTHRIQHELSHLAAPVRRAPRRHHHHRS